MGISGNATVPAFRFCTWRPVPRAEAEARPGRVRGPLGRASSARICPATPKYCDVVGELSEKELAALVKAAGYWLQRYELKTQPAHYSRRDSAKPGVETRSPPRKRRVCAPLWRCVFR